MISIRTYHGNAGLVLQSKFDLAYHWPRRHEFPIWVDIEYPIEADLKQLVDICEFHPLTVDDTVSPHHQPKIDEFDDYLFLVFRSVSPVTDEYDMCYTPERHTREYCSTMKLAVYLGKDFLVTIHDKQVPAVVEMAKFVDTRNLAYEQHLDQILHGIVDRLIDGVFPVLEQLEDEVELIEDEIFADPKPVQLSQILKLKRELLNLRRLISPQREMLSRLSRREDLPYIQPRTAIYFRDVYDHAVRIEEAAIILTDFASGVAEAYLSVASNRMNEAMRVLTVLSTIFMPLTFIAGIYGMNFDYMPELKMTWFYPFLWLLMIAIALAMLVFFRRKKWL
ncbi:MAG: magnesium/cobalt transporter CorA [Acidobacteria bacterium]|nr:magnesium/cobalt transporter CorA [Acidobacteriota bacterium]